MKRRPLLTIGLLAAGCGGGGADRPPNVLVLTLDTVRADRLGCYGGGGGLTPNLDELAARATVFPRCVASSPWTVPSHASMFTGLDPYAHGAHSFEVFEEGVDNVYPLDEEHTTLAEVLSEAGFDTAGVVANGVYLKAALGLNQGFDHWYIARERAPRLNGEVLRWLDGREGDAPWFLFVNYMDAHRPYNVEPLEGEREFGPDEYSGDLLSDLYRRVMIRGKEAQGLSELIQEQYDRAVRNLDRALGELFEDLKERGVWDDTIVVVLSDHGEYFGEHRLVEHSKDVYQEALEVPLIIKYAGQSEGRSETLLASHAHMPRLILDGISEAFGERHDAQFPRLPGVGAVVAENYYSRLRDLQPALGGRFRRIRSVLVEDDYKLIRSSDGAHELYRLSDDPREQSDRAELEPQRLQRMLVELEALREAGRYEPETRGRVILDAADLEEIEAMGYGGSDDDDE